MGTELCKKLSIIIPVFNERATILGIIQRVQGVTLGGMEREIIVVDDGSTDGTRELLGNVTGIVLHLLPSNGGKGVAVREGLQRSTGDYVLIQDADAEYFPEDIPALMSAAQNGAAVVYGSRRKVRVSATRFYRWGGIAITWLTNVLFATALTDQPTGYKLFRRALIDPLTLRSTGFEFCSEITATFAKRGVTIVEVPIRYAPRRIGKKLTWRDGFRAAWMLLSIRILNR